MVSTGVKRDEVYGDGPYFLRIHDAVYCLLGPVQHTADSNPVFGQAYIYDVDEWGNKIQNASKPYLQSSTNDLAYKCFAIVLAAITRFKQ